MINILRPLWSALTIGGGEKSKYEIIYLQNKPIIDGKFFYKLYLIIRHFEINSFDIFSTFKGMKLKEQSSKKLVKQQNTWKILNLCVKDVGKNNDQHT
jgi:hypothetical protein